MNKLQQVLLCILFSVSSFYGQNKNIEKKIFKDTLTIEGNNIWIRSEPITGNVEFKLNNGNICHVLKKGKKQSIGTATDYWYLISFNNKKGWVFGSQTSIKQNINSPNFKLYLQRFLNKYFFDTDIDVWIHHLKARKIQHKEINYFRLYNEGTVCELTPYKLTKNYNKKIVPKTTKALYFKGKMPINGICVKSESIDGVYFKEVNKFPSYTILTEEYESKEIALPLAYKRGKKMKAVIVDKGMIIKTLYFIAADNNWWLVVIDDCNCEA